MQTAGELQDLTDSPDLTIGCFHTSGPLVDPPTKGSVRLGYGKFYSKGGITMNVDYARSASKEQTFRHIKLFRRLQSCTDPVEENWLLSQAHPQPRPAPAIRRTEVVGTNLWISSVPDVEDWRVKVQRTRPRRKANRVRLPSNSFTTDWSSNTTDQSTQDFA